MSSQDEPKLGYRRPVAPVSKQKTRLVRPTLSSFVAARVRNAAAARGVAADAIAESCGIAPGELRDPDVRIDGERYLTFLGEIVAATGDRAFPIAAASYGDEMPEPENLLRFVCLSSASIGEALGRASRYLSISTELQTWRLEPSPEAPVLHIVHRLAKCPSSVYSDEFAAAEIVRLARVFSGTAWSPTEVRFAHDGPSETRLRYEDYFGAKVRFGASRTEMQLTRALLAAPILSRDPAMQTFFDDLVRRLLAQRRDPGGGQILPRVQALLAKQLHDDPPTMERLAVQLHMSARTLRRRLESEGTTFKAVLDETRFEMARMYLERGDTSIGEVSFLLGFSDVTAFHRAFRRWTGETPAVYKEKLSASEVRC